MVLLPMGGLIKIGTVGETIPLTAGEKIYGGTDENDL